MKIRNFVVPFAFLMAFVPAVAFAQNDTDSTVPKETTAITTTAPVTTTAEVTTTTSITEAVQAAEAAYDGCDEIEIDGPIWAWHGEIVTFTLHIEWPGKPSKYELFNGSGQLLETFDKNEVVHRDLVVTKQMDPNHLEILDEYFILIQGPLVHPWCEENHIVVLTTPAILYLPLIAVANND